MGKQVELGNRKPASQAPLSIVSVVAALGERVSAGDAIYRRLWRGLLQFGCPRRWSLVVVPIIAPLAWLIASFTPISWALALSEGVAAFCALVGAAVLRSSPPVNGWRQRRIIAGAALLLVAVVEGAPVATRAGWFGILDGALALGVIGLFVAPSQLRWKAPDVVRPLARFLGLPLVLGPGLVVMTALAQRRHVGPDIWLLGFAVGLLVFAQLGADALAERPTPDAIPGPWDIDAAFLPGVGPRDSLLAVGAAVAIAFTLVVIAAIPSGAPHGALLAVVALPVALIALAGLHASRFASARARESLRLRRAFELFGLTLASGLLINVAVVALVTTLVTALVG